MNTRLLGVVTLLLAMVACGGGGSGDSGIPAVPPSPPPPEPASGRFVYVSVYNTTTVTIGLEAYRLADDGSMAAIPAPPGGAPFGVKPVIHPSNKFTLALGLPNDMLKIFRIDFASGYLVPIPGTPHPSTNQVRSVVLHPSGRFAYVSDGMADSIYAFSIDPASGALTEIAGSPFIGLGNGSLAIEPLGLYIYAAAYSGRWVRTIGIDPVTGALTASSELLADSVSAPAGVALDPQGNHFYVGNTGSQAGRVSHFTIDRATGQLTFRESVLLAPWTDMLSMEIPATGNRLFAGGGGSLVTATIDAATGALTVEERYADFFSEMKIDPRGQLLVTTNTNTLGWQAYRIDGTTGRLVTPPGISFVTAGTTWGAAMTR